MPGPDPILHPTAVTIKLVAYFGRINCSIRDMADYFDVAASTMHKFLEDNPEAKEAFVRGKGKMRVSIRRKQYEALIAGSVPMAIFLGKQELDQTDKARQTHDVSEELKALMEGLDDIDGAEPIVLRSPL